MNEGFSWVWELETYLDGSSKEGGEGAEHDQERFAQHSGNVWLKPKVKTRRRQNWENTR